MNDRIGRMLSGALCIAALSGAAPSPSTAPVLKAPITLGKETTAITTPLLPDGMPDYVAALNAKYGKDVTPANNGLLPFLKIRGTAAILPEKTRAKILELAGVKADEPGTEFFEPYATYAPKHNSLASATQLSQQIQDAQQKLWTATDNPGLADYLQAQRPFFDLAEEAAERPRFFVPFVSEDGTVMMATVMSHTGFVDLGRAWGARAMLRAASGDFDGATRDLVGIKKLARRLPGEGLVLGVLLGYVMDRMANAGVTTMAMSGNLSGDQCDALTKAIQMPPMPTIADEVDTLERWRTLDVLIQMSKRGAVSLVGSGPEAHLSDPGVILFTIEMASMDWNLALKVVNQRRDAEVAAINAPTAAAMKQAVADLKAERDMWQKDFKANGDRLGRQKDEPQADYTARVIHGLMVSILNNDLSSREGDHRVLEARNNMLPVLVAAAKVKAKTGAWPKSPGELVPGAIKEMPADPYAANGGKVGYRLAGVLPQVFSVGPDAQADTEDDIVVGAEPPPVTPSPPPAPARVVPADLP